MLTIAIPTYNRNQLLKECIAHILPQLKDYQLLVVDNASDVPVTTTLGPWLEEVKATNVRIVRNPVNIGGAANILRCLEVCSSKWMYCLGDDDLIAHDCIANIEQALQRHPNALYINFSRERLRRTEVVHSIGVRDFVEKLDDWSTFLFMSGSIVNAERMRPAIRWGHIYAYSWAPLQAILLKVLGVEGEVVFSNAMLCETESLAEDTWDPFPVIAGRMVLPELLDTEDLRRKLALKLRLPLLVVVYSARSRGAGAKLEANRYWVELYLERCARYGLAGGHWLHRALAYVVLRREACPDPIFRWVERFVFRVLGRSLPKVGPTGGAR